MDILQFKTNINCNSCVQKASQQLDKMGSVKNWEVETSNSNKVLTIRGKQLEPKKIQSAIKKAGFRAELLGQLQAKR